MSAIALLTDFGTRDYFVGAMKGTILSIDPGAVIIDITHDIPPQDIREAAFALRACYRDFPPGTIFVAVIDPGVGSGRRAIVAEADGFYFVAPDNGLLSFIVGDHGRVYEITEERFFRSPVGNTFHGRDIFAPVAAHLSLGAAPGEFGREITDHVLIPGPAPLVTGGRIEGEVIHIDRFGNIVTSVTSGLLPASYSIELEGRVIERHCKYYAEAEKGEIFAIAGSAGFLEISVRDGSAAKEMAVETGNRIVVRTGG